MAPGCDRPSSSPWELELAGWRRAGVGSCLEVGRIRRLGFESLGDLTTSDIWRLDRISRPASDGMPLLGSIMSGSSSSVPCLSFQDAALLTKTAEVRGHAGDFTQLLMSALMMASVARVRHDYF